METHVQAEPEFIEVKSPIDRFREGWKNLSAANTYLRQRKFILESPDLIQYAELARVNGWKQPLMYALQGLLFAALFVSALSWLITHDEGRQADEIERVKAELETQLKTEQGVIDASQFEITHVQTSRKNTGFTVAHFTNLSRDEALQQLNTIIEEAQKQQDDFKQRAQARIQNLRATGDALDLAHSGTPVIFCLALVFAAPLFRLFMQKPYGGYKLAGQADGYYLYYVCSRGLWFSLGIVLVLNTFLSAPGFGLGGLTDGIGPIGRIIFWLAVYCLTLYWFFGVSKDLYRALQLPRIKDYTGLENKVLLHMHNSFWLTFLVFESALGLLAYGVYLLEKA